MTTTPIVVEFLAGEHISRAAERLVREAIAADGPAEGDFNGVRLTATPGTLPGEIVLYYDVEFDRRSRERRESPEGKERARRDREETRKLQRRCDRLVAGLESLDFADLDAVLGWICKFQLASDRIGVAKPVTPIVERFARHGFRPGVNCDDDFDSDDRENVARYIVGQALSCLMDVGAIHQVTHKFVKDWRAKFGEQLEAAP